MLQIVSFFAVLAVACGGVVNYGGVAYGGAVASGHVGYAQPAYAQQAIVRSAPIAYAQPAVAYAAAPVVHHQKVAVVAPEPFDPNPQYNYGYSVQDGLTGDQKNHQESRNGDLVQGQYSLVEPDGAVRTVTYTADSINGFNAVVDRSAPAVAVAKVHAAPVYAAAPAIAKIHHAAPALAYGGSQLAYGGAQLAYGGAQLAYGGAQIGYAGAPLAYNAGLGIGKVHY